MQMSPVTAILRRAFVTAMTVVGVNQPFNRDQILPQVSMHDPCHEMQISSADGQWWRQNRPVS